jgi:hypothetical protein
MAVWPLSSIRLGAFLRDGHLCCRLQTMMEPMRMALATTASSGQRRCVTWLCLTFGLAHLRGG